MFKRILIANRGEIAVRDHPCLPRDGHRIGRRVLRRGPSRACMCASPTTPITSVRRRPSESYLNIDKILDVARRSGAEAIHPGYGFLSENAKFARACREAGVEVHRPHAGVDGDDGLQDHAPAST